MVRVKFKYKDEYTHGNWNYQECLVSDLKECIEFYGLGTDCEYEIISIENAEE